MVGTNGKGGALGAGAVLGGLAALFAVMNAAPWYSKAEAGRDRETIRDLAQVQNIHLKEHGEIEVKLNTLDERTKATEGRVGEIRDDVKKLLEFEYRRQERERQEREKQERSE